MCRDEVEDDFGGDVRLVAQQKDSCIRIGGSRIPQVGKPRNGPGVLQPRLQEAVRRAAAARHREAARQPRNGRRPGEGLRPPEDVKRHSGGRSDYL